MIPVLRDIGYESYAPDPSSKRIVTREWTRQPSVGSAPGITYLASQRSLCVNKEPVPVRCNDTVVGVAGAHSIGSLAIIAPELSYGYTKHSSEGDFTVLLVCTRLPSMVSGVDFRSVSYGIHTEVTDYGNSFGISFGGSWRGNAYTQFIYGVPYGGQVNVLIRAAWNNADIFDIRQDVLHNGNRLSVSYSRQVDPEAIYDRLAVGPGILLGNYQKGCVSDTQVDSLLANPWCVFEPSYSIGLTPSVLSKALQYWI